MDRHEAEELYRRADRLFCSGKANDALACLQALRAEFTNDKKVLYANAKCRAGMGKLDEAESLCKRLIDEHHYDRAQQLLTEITLPNFAMLRNDLLDVEATPPPYPKVRSTFSFRWRNVLGAATVGTLFVIALVYPILYGQRPSEELSGKQSHEPNPWSMSVDAATLANLALPRDSLEHPPSEWLLTAINGVPDWKSGIYRRVPGITSPKWTIDVFLPTAYDDYPDKFFPCVIIQMPEGNPGFLGLRDWAEQDQVILVGLNESKNRARGHIYYNEVAQEQALATIVQNMRLDLRLGFAIGTSGGGKSSWHLVARYPQHFQGLVMMAMGSDDEFSYIPPHVRIAYIHGESDFNNPHIAKKIPQMMANGNQVRELVIPGGHVSGRTEDIIMMLEWMVSDARRSFGLPHP